MNVLICGHSFIHRLDSYLNSHIPGTHPPPTFHSHQVTFIGKGGSYLSGTKFNCLMHNVYLYLATSRCHVVYLALGTNDLDRGVPPIQVAQRLISLAQNLQAAYNLRYVFLDQIINRDPLKYPGFSLRAKETNTLLQQLLSQAANPAIILWHHRNFTKPKVRLLQDDGVHPNKVGMNRYWRSLRGAVIYAERH